MKSYRHPLHQAFEDWKISEEGKGCHDSSTLGVPDRHIYLAIRLYRAFYAGAHAQCEIDDNPPRLKILVMRVLAYKDRLPAELAAELAKAVQ